MKAAGKLVRHRREHLRWGGAVGDQCRHPSQRGLQLSKRAQVVAACRDQHLAWLPNRQWVRDCINGEVDMEDGVGPAARPSALNRGDLGGVSTGQDRQRGGGHRRGE